MTISQTNSPRFQDGSVLRAEGDAGAIIRVGEERLLEAVIRLLSIDGDADPVRAERFISFSRTNAVRLDGLWSRLDADGRIAHSVLAVPSPGRTAMFFASRPRAKSEVPEIGALIDHVCTAMAAEDVQLGQALLEPLSFLERDAFTSGGFSELARLSYLERPLSKRRPKAAILWPEGVSVEPYRDELATEMIAVLDASYEDTMDCPGLRGLRQTSDILAGHRGTGAFEPELWTLLRLDGRPVGALLLNPSPQHKSIELVYIGLAKETRGRGLGKLLLRHGFALTAGRQERTMTLAVDERNAPALALYRREGFRRVLRRIALIRSTTARVGELHPSRDRASV